MVYIWLAGFKDNKNYIPMCQTHNYNFLAVCIQYKCIFPYYIKLSYFQVTYITQLLAVYIQYKRIFLKMHIPQPPTVIYPPNTIIQIPNTNIHIPKPKGARTPSNWYISPNCWQNIFNTCIYSNCIYILQFWLYNIQCIYPTWTYI